MANPPQKSREGFECPICMASVRPGTAECKSCGRPIPAPLGQRALKSFFGLTGALVFMTLVYFWAIPNMRANSAIALVRSIESDFVNSAMQTIREKQYRFHGWDATVYAPNLVLVTFTYQDVAAGAGGFLAVWWAVDVEKGTATRVKSMADFADNYLLKVNPPPKAPAS